ncbi:acylneuraminate cytidylyltransferase family protein, partial [Pelagibacteraceae bacterium]|nr:acylneuraminate cytidylyltransferase family protein [Pelagibacteraceae bacterium]
MIKNKKILCIIPAKSYSKRLPNKNIKIFNGKPLFYNSLTQAKKSKYIDEVIISTDSLFIKNYLKKRKHIIPFMRPKKFSGSKTKSETVINHVLSKINSQLFDSIILLQPTSPLRTTKIIDKFIEYFYAINSDSLISVNKPSINDKNLVLSNKNLKLKNFINPNNKKIISLNKNLFNINGMVYCLKVEFFKKYKKIYDINSDIKSIPSWRSIDIDTYD